MAQQIGIVKLATGTVTAVSADGARRALQPGDKVFSDEILLTDAGGSVVIENADGSTMDMGRNDQMNLADLPVDPPAESAETPVQASPDQGVEAIQQALLAGADPTQVAEATAAGGAPAAGGAGAGNEGHVPVSVDYLNPVAPVTNGFDTSGPAVAFNVILTDEPLILNPQQGPAGSLAITEPVAQIAVDNIRVGEGDNAVFKIDITGAQANSSLGLQFSNGDNDPNTADASTGDYKTTLYQYSFTDNGPWLDVATDNVIPLANAGDFSVYVRVNTVDDAHYEVDETFSLTATLSANGQASSALAVATIVDNDLQVNASHASVSESALDGVLDGGNPADLAASSLLGTDPASRAETVAGHLDFQGHGATVTGVASGVTGGNVTGNVDTVISGEYGVLKVSADGSYVYTLTENADHATQGGGDDGISDVFSFTVTGANGQQSTSTLNIAINDDVPVARDDSESLKFGEFLFDSVVLNYGDSNGNDSAGADGFGASTLRSVTFAGQTQVFDLSSVLSFETDNGWLDIQSNGHYVYESKGNPGGATSVSDQFSYQITDGDGDYANALLTITQSQNVLNTGEPYQTV